MQTAAPLRHIPFPAFTKNLKHSLPLEEKKNCACAPAHLNLVIVLFCFSKPLSITVPVIKCTGTQQFYILDYLAPVNNSYHLPAIRYCHLGQLIAKVTRAVAFCPTIHCILP